MRTVLGIGLAALLAAPLHAQSVFPVRDEGHARSRTYHVVHYRIEVSFDIPHKKVFGDVTTTVVPFLPEFRTLEFDAEEMQIESVSLKNGTPLKFNVLPKTLAIHLDRSYSYTDTLTVRIRYTCTPKRGLYFTQPDSAFPDKQAQIWTQGEDMDSHFWFPCYDFPNDKSSSEVIATVPSDYVLLSNGRLVSVREDPRKETKTFHWDEPKPHVSYLIMIAAGRYAVLKDRVGNLPLEYWVYRNDTADARICFSSTPDMIRFFEQKIGFPYAWEKYAQVLITDFIEGGMENVSATSLMDVSTVFNARARVDHSPVSLIAHELSHQWWGDVVTCRDWRHLWLNESFASYFDPLYQEHAQGRDEFDYTMYQDQLAGINSDRMRGRKPIVSVGSLTENVYPRGAAVLHMLRFVLGDDLFWRALHHYIVKYQYQCVDTHDLEEAIAEETGQNLYWFFNEWVYGAGYPKFDVSYNWSDSAKAILLTVKQTQTVDSLTGVFHTPVEIEVTTASGSATHRVNDLSRDTTFSIPCPEAPRLVIFDKGNWLLKELNFTKSRAEWEYQAEFAGNPIDRIRAMDQLKELPSDSEFIPLFARAMVHDPFWAVRREAINVSGEITATNTTLRATLQSALLAACRDTKAAVRQSAVAHLGRFHGTDVITELRRALLDSSYNVVGSALAALARADSAHARPMLLAYVDTPSYQSTVADAALRALSTIDSTAALNLAFRQIRYGHSIGERFTSLGIMRRFGKKDSRVRDALVSLLTDKFPFLKSAAARMLGEFGDQSSIPSLQRLAGEEDTRAANAAKASIERIEQREKKQEESKTE